MSNKKVQKMLVATGIIITLLLIIWLLLSAFLKCPNKFWIITLSQWVPIFLGFEITFLFSYFLTNRKNDYNSKLKVYEDIVIKMQKRLAEDAAHLFSLNMTANQIKAIEKTNFYEKELLTYFRSLANYLEFLVKNKGDLFIDEELQFVKLHLDEYKFEMTENVQDYQSVKDKRVYAKKQIDLIDLKLDEIRFKLHP